MFRVSILFVFILIVVLAVIFGYKVFYTYQINKKIQSGEITGKRLVDLTKMVLIAIIIGLIIYGAILTYVVQDYAGMDHVVPRNNYAVIDVSDQDNYRYASYFGNVQLEDASFAKVYNREANEGYHKEVSQSGDYLFTVFTRTAMADSFHPDFLCFVDYIGDEQKKYVCFSKAGFQSMTEEGEGFYGEAAGDIESNLLYIGFLETDNQFDISLNMLNSEAEMKYQEAMHKAYEEDKGEFPDAESFAVETAKISIVID